MKLPAAAYSAEVATSATKAGSYGVFGEEIQRVKLARAVLVGEGGTGKKFWVLS